MPGAVDLLQRREQRRSELPTDDEDVFARYYAAHPDSDGLEAFEEEREHSVQTALLQTRDPQEGDFHGETFAGLSARQGRRGVG